MTSDAAAPLRSDARRNRDQILRAAREIFAERGLSVPMDEIARRAEVGVGTLYRRFPDREALIRAVFREGLQHVVDAAWAAAAEEPSGWDALVRIMNLSAHARLSMLLHADSAAVIAILVADEEVARLRREAVDALARVVELAQREGTLRPDVGAGDLVLLFMSVAHPVRNLTDEAASLAADRVLAIMLDGLRASAAGPLPGRPLVPADVDAKFAQSQVTGSS